MGYLACLDILNKLPENILLSNQHIARLFKFSREQLDYMANVLIKRIGLLKDLFTWDDINYGLDEQWASIYPYSINTSPGNTIDFKVRITNYSAVARTYEIRPDDSNGFVIKPYAAQLIIDPGTESEKTFTLTIPEKTLPGTYPIAVSLKSDGWDLREWCEALITVNK
jgi:hypothetical protein